VAKNSGEAWRELMSEDELARYDQNPERFKTHDPDHVRREKNHVSYNEEYVQHQPGNQNSDSTFRHVLADENDSGELETAVTVTATSRTLINKPPPDPARAQTAKLLVEAIAELAEIPATCFICGEALKNVTQDRVTIIIHSAGRDETAVYCKPCFDEKNVLPLCRVDDWHSKVSPLHIEVAERRAQGGTFMEIGEAMGLDRKKVSRMFDAVKKARKAAG
jgi:hypothetical protein